MEIINWIGISLCLIFWVYLIQDSKLFWSYREKAQIWLTKKQVSNNKWWLWKFPYEYLRCPFCLSFVLNLGIAAFSHDWLSIMTIPVIVTIVYRYTFK